MLGHHQHIISHHIYYLVAGRLNYSKKKLL